MSIKVAVNGTGRIGLCVCKILGQRDDLELVAIHTTMPIDTLIHLLKYDSVHQSSEITKISENQICIGKQKNIQIISTRNIQETHFGQYGAEIVIECTGAFNDVSKASVLSDSKKEALQQLVNEIEENIRQIDYLAAFAVSWLSRAIRTGWQNL